MNEIPEGYEELPPGDQTIVEDWNPEIERLAGLGPIEYDQQRKEAAKRLNIRVSTLNAEVEKLRPHHDNEHEQENDLGLFEPQPWPEKVDGDDLLDQIKRAVSRHVVMTQAQAAVVALWVVHTHTFECWRHTPRLAVTAPEKGCGKSTLLDVLLALVPRGLKTENLSTATMFRVVDGYQPVLLIDEFDTFLKRNEDLRGALNAGHARGGRHLRCEGDNNEVRAFKTFAPAALAGIGSLPATLADRSIPILLQKRKQDEPLEELAEHHVDHLHGLASQAARWVTDNHDALAEIKPEIPDGVINRNADNIRPLLAIAEVVGGDWPTLAREAVSTVMSGAGDDTESIGVRLLADIRTVFEQVGNDRLPSKVLANHLHLFEGQPWAEYGKKEQPISPTQIARLLKKFGIAPGNIRLNDGTVPKGYQLSAFLDVFARYLPNRNATPLQTTVTNGLSDISSRYNNPDVAAEKMLKPAVTNVCSGVAAQMPPTPGNTELSDEQRAYLATMEDDAGERAALQDDGMDIPDFLKRANVME